MGVIIEEFYIAGPRECIRTTVSLRLTDNFPALGRDLLFHMKADR